MIIKKFFGKACHLGVVGLALILLQAGCTVKSGLQTGELPPVGAFVAENGLQFNVQPLSLANLPSSNLIAQNSINRQSLGQLLRSSQKTDYRISSGDILSINLIGYPDITPASTNNASNPYVSGYAVDQQGYIQFPLIGRIQARGLSVPQFTSNLRAKLQRYLKYPDPQVKVIDYRGNKFFVDGDVKQPGEFNITDAPVSLYGALSMAGGVTPSGDSNSIVLTRNGVSYQLGLRSLQELGVSANQLYLQDGDAIHINSRDRNKVYVLGEFGEIKPLEIPDHGLSLAQVMGEAKGLDPRSANAAQIYVVRDHPGTSYTDIYYVDMRTVTNFALANRFAMQANDIVYVDPTGLTRWSRFIGQILPSASTLAILSGL